MIWEAKCERCGEVFNPTPSERGDERQLDGTYKVVAVFTDEDLEHGMNNDQTAACGGPGELLGYWG